MLFWACVSEKKKISVAPNYFLMYNPGQVAQLVVVPYTKRL